MSSTFAPTGNDFVLEGILNWGYDIRMEGFTSHNIEVLEHIKAPLLVSSNQHNVLLFDIDMANLIALIVVIFLEIS